MSLRRRIYQGSRGSRRVALAGVISPARLQPTPPGPHLPLIRRWWWVGTGPAGFLIGLASGHLGIPTWMIALGVFVLSTALALLMYRSNRRWIARERIKRADLAQKERST